MLPDQRRVQRRDKGAVDRPKQIRSSKTTQRP